MSEDNKEEVELQTVESDDVSSVKNALEEKSSVPLVEPVKAKQARQRKKKKAEDKAPVDSGLQVVKLQVLVGTLAYEEGTFEKGSIIYVSKKRAAMFDPKDIKVLA